MCRIGHLQGAVLVAVRTQDGKLVTLQWRTATRAAPCKRIGIYTEGSSVFHVSYRPFAGRGPCGRPHPGWEIGYPAMADGHKGRALQEDRNVHTGSFGLSCVVSAICRVRPLWPSAPRMGNWLPCNGGRPQGPHPARGSEYTRRALRSFMCRIGHLFVVR